MAIRSTMVLDTVPLTWLQLKPVMHVNSTINVPVLMDKFSKTERVAVLVLMYWTMICKSVGLISIKIHVILQDITIIMIKCSVGVTQGT